jgi:hypothetical protein
LGVVVHDDRAPELSRDELRDEWHPRGSTHQQHHVDVRRSDIGGSQRATQGLDGVFDL